MEKTTAAVGAVRLGNSLPSDAVRESAAHVALPGQVHEHTILVENGLSLPQEHLNRVLEGGPAMVEQTPVILGIGAGYLDRLPPVIEHHATLTDTLHLFWDWYSSYALSIFLLFYDKLDSIVSVGGFVLLIIRLIADGPRAYRTLKDYFNGK